jgi:hypothetical protein
MRATLLRLTIVMAVLPPRSFARENFNCFDTPEGQHRCACIGMAGCSEMKSSGNCNSDPVCDQDQLGAVVCSSNAGRYSVGDPTPKPSASACNGADVTPSRRLNERESVRGCNLAGI